MTKAYTPTAVTLSACAGRALSGGLLVFNGVMVSSGAESGWRMAALQAVQMQLQSIQVGGACAWCVAWWCWFGCVSVCVRVACVWWGLGGWASL